MRCIKNLLDGALVVLLLSSALCAAERSALVSVGNLIYAGDKTSVCFSDRFLTTVETDAGIPTVKRFAAVRLSRLAELATTPFCIMNGQEAFAFTAEERANLHVWLDRGGFLLASAGCSNDAFASSFRKEILAVCGADSLRELSSDHALFSTVFPTKDPALSHGGIGRFEGVVRDGRLAVLFSKEGLNDTAHTQGCCCCGGNEVKLAEELMANALVLALVE